MPLDTLTNKTLPITLHVWGEEIRGTYYWQRVSGADLRMLSRLQVTVQEATADETLDILNRCAAFLARVMASWDFAETAGGPLVPLTTDSLFGLGPLLLGALVGAFVREMRLGEPTGSDLPTPLSPTPTSRSRKSSRAS